MVRHYFAKMAPAEHKFIVLEAASLKSPIHSVFILRFATQALVEHKFITQEVINSKPTIHYFAVTELLED